MAIFSKLLKDAAERAEEGAKVLKAAQSTTGPARSLTEHAHRSIELGGHVVKSAIRYGHHLTTEDAGHIARIGTCQAEALVHRAHQTQYAMAGEFTEAGYNLIKWALNNDVNLKIFQDVFEKCGDKTIREF